MVIWVDPWVYSPAGLTWISYMVVFRFMFHSCFRLLLEMSGKLGKAGVTAKARPLPIALQSQGLSLYLMELKGLLGAPKSIKIGASRPPRRLVHDQAWYLCSHTVLFLLSKCLVIQPGLTLNSWSFSASQALRLQVCATICGLFYFLKKKKVALIQSKGTSYVPGGPPGWGQVEGTNVMDFHKKY